MPVSKGTRVGGRKKGTPNKATLNARMAIASVIEGNVGRLQEWLDKIAEEDGPKAAFECVLDLMEYHVPKLARTEIARPEGSALAIHIKLSRE